MKMQQIFPLQCFRLTCREKHSPGHLAHVSTLCHCLYRKAASIYKQKSESRRTPLPIVSRQPHHCENVCRHHASRTGHEAQNMIGRVGPIKGNLAGGQLSSGQGFESHPSHVLKTVNVLLQSHLVSQELTALTWCAYTFSSILDTHKFLCF